MTDDDLMQRDLDGLLTKEESARLREQIAADPEAAASYEQLRRLQGALASMPPAEPPPGLVQDVMRAVRARVQSAPPRLLDRWRAAWARRPGLGFGLAFAAGLLVATALGGLMTSEAPFLGADADTVGAAIRANRAREIGRVPLQGQGLDGEVVAVRASGQVTLRVRIVSTPRVGLSAAWPTGGRPAGFEWRGPATWVAVEASTLEVEEAGAGTYEVRWDEEAAPESVRVRIRNGQGEAAADLALARP